MKSHHLADAVTCPHCKKAFDAATSMSAGESKPRDGDLNLCIECAGLSQYSAGALVELTPAEMDSLPAVTRAQIAKAQMGLQAIKKKRAH